MLTRILRFSIIVGVLLVALVGGIAVSLYDFIRHINIKRTGIAAGALFVAFVAAVGIYVLVFMQRDTPEVFTGIHEHFKYGSIGGELFPYWIWLVMPDVFPEYLPDRAGEGYARMGFIFEPDSPRGRPSE